MTSFKRRPVIHKKTPKPAAVNAIGLAGWGFIWKGGFIVGEGPQQGEGWSLPGLALCGGPGVGPHHWPELALPSHPAASSSPGGLSKHTKQRPALSQGGHCLSEAKLLYLEARKAARSERKPQVFIFLFSTGLTIKISYKLMLITKGS